MLKNIYIYIRYQKYRFYIISWSMTLKIIWIVFSIHGTSNAFGLMFDDSTRYDRLISRLII